MRYWLDESETNSGRLARLGWTIPVYSTPREMHELFRLREPDEVDSYFITYYDQRGYYYERMKQNLLSEPSLNRWHALIKQCFDAYERDHFQITVPALLTILDGLIHERTGGFKQQSNVRQATRKKLNEADSQLKRIIALSIDQYTSEIFNHHPFCEEAPKNLNRHWILHGRDEADWSRTDSLKLLHGIATISLVWHVA